MGRARKRRASIAEALKQAQARFEPQQHLVSQWHPGMVEERSAAVEFGGGRREEGEEGRRGETAG